MTLQNEKRVYTYNGETHTANEWAEIVGLRPDTIRQLARDGKPLRRTRKFVNRNQHTKPTKCWSCENTAYGKCPWFTDFTPVEGWTAEPTKINNAIKAGARRLIDSYLVLDCPLYEPMKKREVDKHNEN